MKIKELTFESLKFTLPGVVAWGLGVILAFTIPYESVYIKDDVIQEKSDCEQKQSYISSEDLLVKVLETNLKCVAINVAGMVTFGIATFVNLFINGFMHGISIRYSLIKIGSDTWELIYPHSFELLGLIISGGAALYGIKIILKILKNDYINMTKKIITLLSIILLSVVIIMVAAYIEAYITYQSI